MIPTVTPNEDHKASVKLLPNRIWSAYSPNAKIRIAKPHRNRYLEFILLVLLRGLQYNEFQHGTALGCFHLGKVDAGSHAAHVVTEVGCFQVAGTVDFHAGSIEQAYLLDLGFGGMDGDHFRGRVRDE